MGYDGPPPSAGPELEFVVGYRAQGRPFDFGPVTVKHVTHTMSPGTVLAGGNDNQTYTLPLGESGVHDGELQIASGLANTSSHRQINHGSPDGYTWGLPLSVSNTAGEPMLSSGSNSYQTPFVWGATSRLASYDIASVLNNGGLIRIQTTAPHSFITNAVAMIEGAQANTGANGSWAVTRIDATTVDLQGSTFTNASGATGHIFPAPKFLVARAGVTLGPGTVMLDADGYVYTV